MEENNEYIIDWNNINPEICEMIQGDMGNVKNNIYSKAWIDFETEISKVIQTFSECIKR